MMMIIIIIIIAGFNDASSVRHQPGSRHIGDTRQRKSCAHTQVDPEPHCGACELFLYFGLYQLIKP